MEIYISQYDLIQELQHFMSSLLLSALFQLSWSVYHGANRIENVHTCLFLCMDHRGRIYTTVRTKNTCGSIYMCNSQSSKQSWFGCHVLLVGYQVEAFYLGVERIISNVTAIGTFAESCFFSRRENGSYFKFASSYCLKARRGCTVRTEGLGTGWPICFRKEIC